MLKFGTYGFLRYAMPLFPRRARRVRRRCSPSLAVIGIIYGALVAFAQNDVKKLVAYSSVAHLGFVRARPRHVERQGVDGAIYRQMLAHGISTGGLFLGIGVLYERRHTRRLAEFGGLWKRDAAFLGAVPDHRRWRSVGPARHCRASSASS